MIKTRTMSGLRVLVLVVAYFGIIGADSSIFSGFLGCRFSQSVCRRNEECVDDRLFGTCQSLNEPRDRYQYILTSHQLHSLEAVISDLIESRNTWDDLYTQCSLSNILLSFREFRRYDSTFCDTGGAGEQAMEDRLTDATVDLLKSYLEDYYQAAARTRLLQDDYPDYPMYDDEIDIDKKDEKINIHKYLKSHKRDPYIDSEYQDLGTDYDRADLRTTKHYPDIASVDYDTDDFLSNLTPEKLKLLQQFLVPLTPDDTADVIDEGSDDYMDNEYDKGVQDIQDVEGVQSTPVDDDYAVMASIDPGDAQLLDQLLQGKVKVSDLDDDEISHLAKYVDGLLEPLRKYGTLEEPVMEPYDDPGVKVIDEPPIANSDEELDRMKEDILPMSASKLELLDSDVLDSGQENNLNVEKKIHPNNPHDPVTTPAQAMIADLDRVYIKIKPQIHGNIHDAARILYVLERHLGLKSTVFTNTIVKDDLIDFKVTKNMKHLNATEVIRQTKGVDADEFKNETGFEITEVGVPEYKVDHAQIASLKRSGENGVTKDFISDIPDVISAVDEKHRPQYNNFVLTFVLCGVILGIVLSVIAIYIVKRHLQSKEKLAQLSGAADGVEASNDYQDLCRQRMQTKSSEKPEPLHITSRLGSVSASEGAIRSPSSRSSTSSRSEEPVVSNMDISTGHIILSYMEDHIKNKDRLDQEWAALCVYEAEPNGTSIASDTANMRKNKYSDVLPYDHSRVILTSSTNVSGSDYINASTITDHDPRNPAYICTQGPLPHTVADFWQMVWEQGSVVIVNLTKLVENTQTMCHRYWPEEGSDLYHIYEVHLVSEHIWCDEYLVRCFYLKNLQTNETRTVSQFHFGAWPDLGIPSSAKALLDFRRKVNKSYRGQNCPIVVQCSDGSGRSGSYCLLDMVLNRMSKGAKEIDIAATLEHIRDQRMQVVKTKEQFEFVLASVAEEVHAILKALPQ